uniref:Integrase core domain-containing protein n=1 Tax=Stegastes partitus TaxID=144197 RepID=A0A3B5AAB7_9TELE
MTDSSGLRGAAHSGEASQVKSATCISNIYFVFRIRDVLNQPHLNLDYLQYIVDQEALILAAASSTLKIPAEIVECLLSLQSKIHAVVSQDSSCASIRAGGRGRPKLIFSEEFLSRLIDVPLSVSCIANLLGVSQSTIFQRMHELGLSTRAAYSRLTDSELDDAVQSIKSRITNAGYRMVKGCLQADGHRVQWDRIKESMHRVNLGCIARRTYSVQGPCLMLISITFFFFISLKIIYLMCLENYGIENVSLAETMFTVKGAGRESFIAGQSVLERLWRDFFTVVRNMACCIWQMLFICFSAHYVLVPRLAGALHAFTERWDNQPLWFEGGLSPDQLWVLGHMKNEWQFLFSFWCFFILNKHLCLQPSDLYISQGTDWNLAQSQIQNSILGSPGMEFSVFSKGF